MYDKKLISNFPVLLLLIFFPLIPIQPLKLFARAALVNMTKQTEEKVYILLKPQAELGEAPTITIFPMSFDEKTNLGKIPIKAEPVGFWRSKKRLNDTLYDLFEIPEGSYTTEIGEPMISTISVEVEIPADAKFKEASEKATIIRKFENVILAPQQEPLPIVQPLAQQEKFIQEKPKFIINNEVYKQTTPYPGVYSKIIADSFFGERHIVIVKLFPIQFYPAQKEAKIYSIAVDLIFTK